jgi:predicted GIY-YIG superfamily endonuclease
MSTKTCNCCKVEKPVACFSKNKSQKDGIHRRCKSCDIEASKQWRDKRPEYKKAYDKKLYNSRREKYDAMVIDNHFSIEPAVYMIKNMVNGKCYIGTSKAPYRRVHQHLSYHEEGAKLCTPEVLADEVAFYGKKSFIWGILEYTTKENKHSKEREYISIYQPAYNNRK